MDWDNSRRHVVLHAPPGGKTSISIFGNEDDQKDTYKKSSETYAPPAPTAPATHMQAAPATYGYSAPPPAQDTIENTNPYTTSAPASSAVYGGYSAEPPAKVTTFGKAGAMRTEHNLGADGNERSSVKVHHPPGGGGSLNIFGAGPEPGYSQETYAPPKETGYAPTGYGYQDQAPSAHTDPAGYGSMEPKGYGAPEPKGYGSYEPAGYAPQEPAPVNDFNNQRVDPAPEEYKQTYPDYSAPPSGFQSSAAYAKPQEIMPTNLNVSSAPQTFGQRVESGSNSGPTTDKSSIRVHAPPGGKSSIFF